MENATSFERDTASLLQRYDPDRKPRSNRTRPGIVQAATHSLSWALSPSMWEALKTCMGITNEMFASPLDRSPHSEAYWSIHKEDELFGANHNAYSRPWTGACQAYVGDSPEDNDKAIRHAIGSVTALPNEVTCIIMFIPSANPEAPHLRHLSDPNVRVLTTLEAGNECDSFKPPGHWLNHRSETTPTGVHPTMHVIAIATKPGASAHLSPTRVHAFAQATGLRLNPEPPSPTPSVTKSCPIPKSIGRMLSTESPPLPPIRKSPVDTPKPPHVHLPCTYPLSGAPTKGSVVAYTDGSCKKHPDGSQSIGAAVYFPSTPQYTDPISVTVNPNGKGPTLTINRAELSGIHQALAHERSNLADALHIYTDSLCSLSLIRRMITSPWTLRDCKHLYLLNDILNTIRTRSENGQRTSFHKVKSHVGVRGNEEADKTANKAAMDPQHTDTIEDSNNSPYEDKVWVKYTPPPNLADPKPMTSLYLSNLSEDIKRKVTPHHSGGQFTTTGLYAQLWNKAIGSLLPSSVSRIWTDPAITWYQATLALKARWGQLYTNKLAHRYGRAKSDLCPTCKSEPDSVGHLLGGCKEKSCKAITIERHNVGVRICHRAITRSSTFGGCYCVMDACSSTSLPPGVDSTRLPAWILPAGHPYLQEVTTLRPDILIIEGLASNDTHGRTDDEIRQILLLRRRTVKVHILEVGYCSDLRHSERDAEKQQQHDRLVQILTGKQVNPRSPPQPIAPTQTARLDDPSHSKTQRPPPGSLETSFQVANVIYHPPITLGRTGTLQASFHDTLRNKLKVNPKAIDECANKLTQHAVHYVEKFYKHRFANLTKHANHNAQPRQGAAG